MGRWLTVRGAAHALRIGRDEAAVRAALERAWPRRGTAWRNGIIADARAHNRQKTLAKIR